MAYARWYEHDKNPLWKNLADKKINRLLSLTNPKGNGLYFRMTRGYDPTYVEKGEGKVVALGHTGGDQTGEPQRTIAEIGPPTRKAESSKASLLVWESGPNARFWLNMKAVSEILPRVTLTIAWVSPRWNSDEPCTRGSTPVSITIGRMVSRSRPSTRSPFSSTC